MPDQRVSDHAWPRAFLAVPVSRLEVDLSTTTPSQKATPEEMRVWMRAVPKIYRLQQRGVGDADFKRMCDLPRSAEERVLGETYRNLFSASPSAQPLRADLVAGRAVVQAGQHRVIAAREAGVSVLPVHVSAPDRAGLLEFRRTCEAEARTLEPELHDIPSLHRRHDEHLYGPRARVEDQRGESRRPDPLNDTDRRQVRREPDRP